MFSSKIQVISFVPTRIVKREEEIIKVGKSAKSIDISWQGNGLCTAVFAFLNRAKPRWQRNIATTAYGAIHVCLLTGGKFNNSVVSGKSTLVNITQASQFFWVKMKPLEGWEALKKRNSISTANGHWCVTTCVVAYICIVVFGTSTALSYIAMRWSSNRRKLSENLKKKTAARSS